MRANLNQFLDRQRVAYFTMELALRPEIHTYSGGLGILAGDTIRTAADLGLPMVAVTLVSHKGYFRQELTAEGRQVEHEDGWDPASSLRRLGAKVAVNIGPRLVWIGAWLGTVEGRDAAPAPVIFLDTDLPENEQSDREITNHLYGGDAAYRLRQEIVLGIGGLRMLQALRFRIRKFHLNEGHAALLPFELLRQRNPRSMIMDVARIRSFCSFTTHTPVSAGHDVFPYDLVQQLLGDKLEGIDIRRLGGADQLNMTQLALNLCGYVNGVAKRHAETSQQMFPEHHIRSITNGVHAGTWTAPAFASLFDQRVPGWRSEPEILIRADLALSDEDVWNAHEATKRALLDELEKSYGVKLDPAKPVIGFARRMTGYKRPELLFADPERLRAIAKRHPFQILLAGKAHRNDNGAKETIRVLHQTLKSLAPEISGAFLPNYNMSLAQILVPGVDLWLNTPLPPLEASGTSGMKAALNGVPSLSVLDGWWLEGCIEGNTGWAIGDGAQADPAQHAQSLYMKLEEKVLPCYYENRKGWLGVMKGAISHNGSLFNSHRMMRRYAAESYF